MFTPASFTPNPDYEARQRRNSLAGLMGNMGGIDVSYVTDPFSKLAIGAMGQGMVPREAPEPQGNSIRRLLGMKELQFPPDPQVDMGAWHEDPKPSTPPRRLSGNSAETQAWLNGMTPDNRRIWSLMGQL